MKSDHLSDAEMARVARGESDAVRRWLEHVVQGGCDECLAASQPLLDAVLLDGEAGEGLEPEDRNEELSRNLPGIGEVTLATEPGPEPGADYDAAVARAEAFIKKQAAGIRRRPISAL